MVLPLKQTVIYGPVKSRRLGKSLGVNLLGFRGKCCSFDCLYCHYGPTTTHSLQWVATGLAPSREQVLQEVSKALGSSAEFDYVTFSGDGEPTLYPWFLDTVKALKPLIKKMRPQVKLALLSNSTRVDQPEIQEAIREIDVPIMKLDGGDESTICKLNKPAEGFDFGSMLQGLVRAEGIIIQSVFVDGAVSNIDDDSVRKWIRAIDQVRPVAVQIYSIDRPTADASLKIVPKDRLSIIAHKCHDATGIGVGVY